MYLRTNKKTVKKNVAELPTVDDSQIMYLGKLIL